MTQRRTLPNIPKTAVSPKNGVDPKQSTEQESPLPHCLCDSTAPGVHAESIASSAHSSGVTSGESHTSGDSTIHHAPNASGESHASGDSYVSGEPHVSGEFHASDEPHVSGESHASDEPHVSGESHASSESHTSGDSTIHHAPNASGESHASGDSTIRHAIHTPLASASKQSADDDDAARIKAIFPLGRKPLIGYLTALNSFIPLAIDLYLPSLPQMSELFQCPQSLTAMTLSVFMLGFSISMLFWGPFSDKVGRKPVLYAGTFIFMVGSLVCATAPTIYVLIAGRAVQAIGSGAISAVSMAIVKDVFKGRVMENVLIWIQTMTVLCPMLAPLVGSLLLKYTSWRGLFFILMCIGILGFSTALFLKESITVRTEGNTFTALGRILVVLRNRGLRYLLFLFALAIMPFMAYLTSSSFIYIKMYGLSQQEFGYFFGINALFAMLGPLLYSRFFRYLNRRRYLATCFSIMIASGVLLYLLGDKGPVYFLLCYVPLTLAGSSFRPLGTVLVMSQIDSDSGTVSALIGSTNLLFGSISMMICALDWATPVLAVSIMAGSVGTACILLWLWLDTHKVYRMPLHNP